MNQIKLKTFLAVFAISCFSTWQPSFAQVVPDNTLPGNTKVNFKGSDFTITGGTRRGDSLFHSFDKFSVSNGSTAYFNNNLEILNIFSRVTGSSISQIDGLLRANGSTNLFLLNPNGILFGPNASLKIGGSFLASSAAIIHFSDGSRFSTTDSSMESSLVSSLPIGLEFRQNPGVIVVRGSGHNLIGQNLLPVVGAGQQKGLTVNQGKTLALIGGNVSLDGGVVNAPGGQVVIASVKSGTVDLNSNSSGLQIGVANIHSFGDVSLKSRALVDASGLGNSSIRIYGRNVKLVEGSVGLIQSQGGISSGSLMVKASESLLISGTDEIARIAGGFRTDSLGLGNGGDIVLSAPQVSLIEGGTVNTNSFSLGTFNAGKAGEIFISAPKKLEVVGRSPRSFRTLSNISSIATSEAGSGDITLTVGELTARDGGLILSGTGAGPGGNVTVEAETINLLGVEPISLAPSGISAATAGSGNAGKVTINTGKLLLKNGGRVDSSTLAAGNAGGITINASESIEVSGQAATDLAISSSILSAGSVENSIFRATFGVPDPSNLTGNAGNVTLNTTQLLVNDGGQIGVRNDGTGNAGNLEIKANLLTLNRGELTAASTSGNGGDIVLDVSTLLQLQGGSNITASARGEGFGGNIRINTPLLVAVEGSSISADAEQNTAGRIQIRTTGLYLSRDSKITATSLLGPQFDGVIDIDTPDINLATKPQLGFNLTVGDQALTCIGQRGTNLSVITASDLDKTDDQLEAIARANNIPMFLDGSGRRRPLIEVQGWIPNGDGTARTIAVVETPSSTTAQFGTPCLAANE